jgi:hypothetical protein
MSLDRRAVLVLLIVAAALVWTVFNPLAGFDEGAGSPRPPGAVRGEWRLETRRSVSPPLPTQPSNTPTHLIVALDDLTIAIDRAATTQASVSYQAYADGSVAVTLPAALSAALGLEAVDHPAVLQSAGEGRLRLKAGAWEFTWGRPLR